MDTKDSVLFRYECARREAMIRKGVVTPGEIAEDRGLSPAFSRILVAVVNDWPNNKDAFFETMKDVYQDESNEPAARAMAAEHASSCFEGEQRREWYALALALCGQVGELDARLLRSSTFFGEWDKADRTITAGDVRAELDFMIHLGAYNAASRTLWWVGLLEKRFGVNPDARIEAVGFLQSVVDRADRGSHAFNEFYLDKVRARLQELRPP